MWPLYARATQKYRLYEREDEGISESYLRPPSSLRLSGPTSAVSAPAKRPLTVAISALNVHHLVLVGPPLSANNYL